MKKIVLQWVVVLVGLVSLVTGCASMPVVGARRDAGLVFDAAIAVSADESFKASLSVSNASDTRFAGDKRFNGEMALRYAETDALRASANVVPLQAIAPGGTVWPLAWEGELTPGGYILTWGAAGYGETQVRFEIVEQEGRLYLGGTVNVGEGDGSAMPDLYVGRAVVDLSAREGAPKADIRVVDVTRAEFPDTSLGMPEPGVAYAQVVTPGYVIELALGDAVYTYHAAGERVVLVQPDASDDRTDSGEAVKQIAAISEIGLSFAVPGDWVQLEPGTAWAPAGADAIRLGVNWVTLEPPMEIEAVLLPNPAQVLHSEPVELDWAEGRWTTLEVFAPEAEQGPGQAPVVAVETHVLLTVVRGERRLGIDLYLSAPTAEELDANQQVLDELVESAVLAAEPYAASRLAVEVPGDWQKLTVEGPGDAGWRFSFALPPDWMTKQIDPRAGGGPADWPVVVQMHCYPEAWAERFERTGPPDRDAPPTYVPLMLEVVVGSEAQLRRAYVPPTHSEVLDIGGPAVVRELEGADATMTPIRYVIQHPEHPEVWLVLTDMIGGFLQRIAGNESVAEVIPVVVQSVVVEE